MKDLLSKIIFSSPIALFFGIGVFISTDIIQPSYFRNIGTYYGYFLLAIAVGYLSIILASTFISHIAANKVKAYCFMALYMCVEALFSFLAITTYYGNEQVPLIRQITALCLPLVFSLFYFMKLIETTKQNQKPKDTNELLKKFDELESTKPNLD